MSDLAHSPQGNFSGGSLVRKGKEEDETISPYCELWLGCPAVSEWGMMLFLPPAIYFVEYMPLRHPLASSF